MRIDHTEPAKAHLTVPVNALQYVKIWHMQNDFASLTIDDVDYMWVEGRLFGQTKGSTDLWHPSQLVIDLCRMARTKSLKWIREWAAKQTEFDLHLDDTPYEIPATLSVSPKTRQYITAYVDGADIAALRFTDGTNVMIIAGKPYPMSAERGGAAALVEYWDTLKPSELLKATQTFIKLATKDNAEI